MSPARSSSRSRAKPQVGPRQGRLWRWRRPLFLVALIAVLAVAGAGFLFASVPLPAAEPPLLQTSFVCAADVTTGCEADNSMAQLSGGVDRVSVTYDQLPPVLIDAVIAAEDRKFFEHRGVDPLGIVRAFWSNVRNEGIEQGGSTITQQYVKNVYLTQERTISRKLKEAALAVKVERELSKQEILTRYLNVIYFGRGAYGVEAASRTYFGKNVGDLTLPEAAYLAGLIRAPELADAQLPPDDSAAAEQRTEAGKRRTSVLDGMLDMGKITQAQHDEAANAGWDDVLVRTQSGNYGHVAHPELGTDYFIDYVRHWLTTEGGFTDAQVFGGGLRIYTTLDYTMQAQAMDAVTSTLNRPGDPAAALVSIDQQGRVRAMVGGRDYQTSTVNLAVGKDGGGSGRGPGSSFKPIVLAEALKQGIPLTTTFDSPAKKVFPNANAGADWSVENYGGEAFGRLNLLDATRDSVNTAYAQLVLEVGPDNAAALAKRMGITSQLDVVPSIVLGTSSVSVLDMATAYSTFADNGQHIGPFVVTRVTDANGTVLYEAPNNRDQVIPGDVAAQVNWTLAQVILSGTGTGARIAQPAAGKTGTTEDYRDAWFVGYTCSLTTAVWMGYPGAPGTPVQYMNSVHGQKVTGGSFPATIWRKYMSQATDGLPACEYPKPDLAPATNDTAVSGTAAPSSSTTSSSSSSTTSSSSSSTTSSTTSSSTTTSSSSTTTSSTTTTTKP